MSDDACVLRAITQHVRVLRAITQHVFRPAAPGSRYCIECGGTRLGIQHQSERGDK